MRIILIFIFIILIANVSALCEEGQIDINSASAEELDQLYGIGPVKAQAIIDTRPFNSIDDLINVNGIGEITLNNIKNQELACIDKEETGESTLESNDTEETTEESTLEITGESENKEQNSEVSIIKLTPKTIKTEEKSENLDKKDLATYGFIGFCILLAFLFALKYLNKKFKENELA